MAVQLKIDTRCGHWVLIINDGVFLFLFLFFFQSCCSLALFVHVAVLVKGILTVILR